MATKYGAYGNPFPRIPGHEIAGEVDEVGEGVTDFKKGEHVGVGWFGGHCGECGHCKKDAWVTCENGKICGIHYDGGFAEYMVAPKDALARIPEGYDFSLAGPLLCAGITTFNSIRHSGAKAGDFCVIQGVGGLGHLAVQYANKLGLTVIAVSQGKDKEELAKKLGAHHYVDGTGDFVKEIKAISKGGVKLIVTTAPDAKAVESIIPALGLDGKLLLLAAIEKPISVSGIHLLVNRCSISGWPSGDSRDSEETLIFSAQSGVKAMVQCFPLEKANEAFGLMLSNKARFRVVLTMTK
jgi:alcohol dehydrogenase/propanol-preferring alcohol dehydrogenase